MAYAKNDSARIYYEDRGEGDPILLITGLGGSGEDWRETPGELAMSHRAITLDPRGAGRSDRPDMPYTGALVAGDVKAVLDAAGVGRAHVVGVSMGGMIAQEFAVRHPERLQSLVLIATYAAPDAWSRQVFAVRRMVLDSLGQQAHFKLATLFLFAPDGFRATADEIAALERDYSANNADLPIYLRQFQFCVDHDARDRLGGITAPTLVVTGADDILTTPAQGRDLADLIPHAEFREIPSASHMMMWQKSAELCQLIREFASQHPCG